MSPESNQPLVSACLIVRNEGANLGRCLSSIAGLADEIVVIDTGSTDDTVGIARSFGAKTFIREWQEDFSFHRNQSVAEASGRWVFFIDGDETLDDTDVAETRERLAQGVSMPQFPAVLLVRETLHYPGGRTTRLLAPRVFRNGLGIRFQYRVHEQLTWDMSESIPSGMSNITLDHVGYSDPSVQNLKEERNLHLANLMGDHPHGLYCRARSLLSMERWPDVISGVDAALGQSNLAPQLRIELAAMGGAAAIKLADISSLKKYVDIGNEICANHPDIALMNLRLAHMVYADTIQEMKQIDSGVFIRPLIFEHKRSE